MTVYFLTRASIVFIFYRKYMLACNKFKYTPYRVYIIMYMLFLLCSEIALQQISRSSSLKYILYLIYLIYLYFLIYNNNYKKS